MHCTAIWSPLVSLADSCRLTHIDAAGSTDGNTAKLANAPPLMLTLKSPEAIVGLALKLPGFAMSCRAIWTAKAWPFTGGLEGVYSVAI